MAQHRWAHSWGLDCLPPFFFWPHALKPSSISAHLLASDGLYRSGWLELKCGFLIAQRFASSAIQGAFKHGFSQACPPFSRARAAVPPPDEANRVLPAFCPTGDSLRDASSHLIHYCSGFLCKNQMTESCKRRELPQSTHSTARRANAPSPPGLSQPWQPPPAHKHFVLPAIPRTLCCWPFHHIEPSLRTTECSLRTTEHLATGSATDRALTPLHIFRADVSRKF